MKQLSTFLFVLFTISLSSQGLYYPIDDSHSQVKFSGQLGDWMEVEGSFQKIWGTVYYDEKDPTQTSITFFMDPASVISGNEWRDKHLKNADFLDIEKFPELKFVSQSVQEKEGKLGVIGTLSFKGKEMPFTIPIELITAPTPDPWGNIRLGYKGKLELSRKAMNFGPTEGFWSGNIADAFTINFVISGSRQNMDRMSMFDGGPLKAVWENALKGEMEMVVDTLKKLKVTNERFSPRIVDLTAQRLHQHGHPKTALQLYQLNAALYPEQSDLLSKLALSHLDNGDLATCKTFAEKALVINPQDALAIELLKER